MHFYGRVFLLLTSRQMLQLGMVESEREISKLEKESKKGRRKWNRERERERK